MQTFFSRFRKPAHGFTLIELAIVLGIVGVLAAGLYRILNTSNQQTKDQITAQQHQQLISAVAAWLADAGASGGYAWISAQTSAQSIPLPTSNSSVANCQATIMTPATFSGLCNYLPAGFSTGTTNPYGQTYKIGALQGSTAGTYSFMIATSGGSTIPDADGGRISSLIGGDGGFIYTSTLLCATAGYACGTMGSWTLNPTTYGLATLTAGHVASRTFVSPVSGGSQWLARTVLGGDTTTYTYNTMATNQFFNGYDLYMYNAAGPSGASNIHIFNGALLIEGTNAAGSIELEGAGYITGVGTASGNPQIYLQANNTFMTSAGGVPLIKLSSGGCSAINGGTCAPVLQVTNGDITVAGGEVLGQKIIAASDIRLKKDIHQIDKPLDHLMNIDAVAFTFKKTNSQSMGVTAQNLEKTYPQLVSESDGVKYVEYNGLIGPLIGAVQELKRQNDDLRQQINQQKLREDALESAFKNKIH